MAIRSEGFYLSFQVYLSVNVALASEQANQLCEFGESYFGGSPLAALPPKRFPKLAEVSLLAG